LTKEQIAKLDLSSGPLCCGIHEALVQRLLAERERLLEAGRVVAELLGDGNMNYDERCIPLASAIAFAEGPA
jgi:hypothetical protein